MNGIKITVKPPTTRYVLVDYDNVVKSVAHEGEDVACLANHIAKELDAQSDYFDGAKSLEDVEFRLYGGWYAGRNLERSAQRLQGKISASGSMIYTLKCGVRINLVVRLALSMVSASWRSLFATSRRRDLSELITIPMPGCCETADEHFAYLKKTLTTKGCKYCGKPLLYKSFVVPAQKMVDGMMYCDLASLTCDKKRVALVSSDSDMIPALIQVTQSGGTAYHMLTATQLDLTEYKTMFGSGYSLIKWEVQDGDTYEE